MKQTRWVSLMSLTSLPCELLLEIVGYLEAHDIMNLHLTNHACHVLLTSHRSYISMWLLVSTPAAVREILICLNWTSLGGIFTMGRQIKLASQLCELIIKRGALGPDCLPYVLTTALFSLMAMQTTLLKKLAQPTSNILDARQNIISRLPRGLLLSVCRAERLLEDILHYSISVGGEQLPSIQKSKLQDIIFSGERGFSRLAYVLSARHHVTRFLRFQFCRPSLPSQKRQRLRETKVGVHATLSIWQYHIGLLLLYEGWVSSISSLTNYSSLCETY